MEQITAVTMMVQLGGTFDDLMDCHNLMVCVFKNRGEVKRDKARDNTKETPASTQTYGDRLRLAKVNTVAPPADLPNVTLSVNTFTAEVWTCHGDNCLLYKGMLEWLEHVSLGRIFLVFWVPIWMLNPPKVLLSSHIQLNSFWPKLSFFHI